MCSHQHWVDSQWAPNGLTWALSFNQILTLKRTNLSPKTNKFHQTSQWFIINVVVLAPHWAPNELLQWAPTMGSSLGSSLGSHEHWVGLLGLPPDAFSHLNLQLLPCEERRLTLNWMQRKLEIQKIKIWTLCIAIPMMEPINSLKTIALCMLFPIVMAMQMLKILIYCMACPNELRLENAQVQPNSNAQTSKCAPKTNKLIKDLILCMAWSNRSRYKTRHVQ